MAFLFKAGNHARAYRRGPKCQKHRTSNAAVHVLAKFQGQKVKFSQILWFRCRHFLPSEHFNRVSWVGRVGVCRYRRQRSPERHKAGGVHVPVDAVPDRDHAQLHGRRVARRHQEGLVQG